MPALRGSDAVVDLHIDGRFSPDPPWPLLDRGYRIDFGFDDDKPGNDASRQMIKRHPAIGRLLALACD